MKHGPPCEANGRSGNKLFPALYEALRFIALPLVNRILLLLSHLRDDRPCGLIPSHFPIKILCPFLNSPVHVTFFTSLTAPHNIWWRENIMKLHFLHKLFSKHRNDGVGISFKLSCLAIR